MRGGAVHIWVVIPTAAVVGGLGIYFISFSSPDPQPMVAGAARSSSSSVNRPPTTDEVSIDVFNPKHIVDVRFGGAWDVREGVGTVAYVPQGEDAHTVDFDVPIHGASYTCNVSPSGCVVLGDPFLFIEYESQDVLGWILDGGWMDDSSGFAAAAACDPMTVYNWDNFLSYSASGGCWGRLGFAGGCFSQGCDLPETQARDCILTLTPVQGAPIVHDSDQCDPSFSYLYCPGIDSMVVCNF